MLGRTITSLFSRYCWQAQPAPHRRGTHFGRTAADPTGAVSHVLALGELRVARYRFKDYDEIVGDLMRLEAEYPHLVRLYNAQAEYNLTTIEQWMPSSEPLCGKSVCKQWIVTITVRACPAWHCVAAVAQPRLAVARAGCIAAERAHTRAEPDRERSPTARVLFGRTPRRRTSRPTCGTRHDHRSRACVCAWRRAFQALRAVGAAQQAAIASWRIRCLPNSNVRAVAVSLCR